jgi:hypothetical protein
MEVLLMTRTKPMAMTIRIHHPYITAPSLLILRVLPFPRDHALVVLVGLKDDLVEAAFLVHHVRRVSQQELAAQLLGDQVKVYTLSSD